MTPVNRKTTADLHLAFDVGHSSIGWAVLQSGPDRLTGCGTVIFAADDCLASQRRAYRRQRRHIRATRMRIGRIARLLEHLLREVEPALAAELALYRDPSRTHELTGKGLKAPWLLAARVLRGGKLLSWAELWNVLRWYAHNRGYDGNRAWSRSEGEREAEKEDAEKVQNAIALYQQFGTRTMAETWCAYCGLDPLTAEPNWGGDKRPKGLNAAFPREDVEKEVNTILRRHLNVLTKLDEKLVKCLLEDWQEVPVPTIKLPARYRGGLLFGQLVPRFENRIIRSCPLTYERIYQEMLAESKDTDLAKAEAKKRSKVPAAECAEFYRFRWVMQLANVRVATDDPKNPRPLTVKERRKVDAVMRVRGALTKGEFKKAVREATGAAVDNLEQMLMHPDAEKALLLDPVQRLLTSDDVCPLYEALPERFQKRLRGWLRRKHRISIQQVRGWLEGVDASAFDAAIDRMVDSAGTRRRKKDQPITREDVLAKQIGYDPLTGRAPFSREIMCAAADFILSTDRHPAEVDGPLYRSESIRAAQLQREIDEQTNNHLVRHRLRILERLLEDIIRDPKFANGDKARIRSIGIEVNRDLRELSGKTAKQIAQDLGLRLSNFKSVTAKLEAALKGKGIPITPGLIRKARIAEDLNWTCPYTGKPYDVMDLVNRRVDKDHIVPRSERASDSLDSLVITFTAVNRMKGKRTAALFVEQEQSKTVPGEEQLTIKPLSIYLKDVEALETFKGHDDDKRRKKNRKRLLLLRDYVEKEFTPRDLTQTSQLVRLAAQALERHFAEEPDKPVVTSFPGAVTGALRKSWHLLPLLSAANPNVIEPESGDVRVKTEIRDITHLHHALDACVLALAVRFLPRDGDAWQLLIKRRLTAEERKRAGDHFGQLVRFEQDGTLHLIDLPELFKKQIRDRLAERRVVQHIPAEMRGLRAELNSWRVVRIDGDSVHLRQRIRQPDGTRKAKERKEQFSKVVGLRPGKLQRLKGALIIADNYGLALDPEPEIIPFHNVWRRLRELQQRNGGIPVRLIRKGCVIRIARPKTAKIDYSGIWMVRGVTLHKRNGCLVDLSPTDQVLYRDYPGSKQNVSVRTLMQCGLEVLETSLCGIPAPRS